jgi:histone H3/H4
VGAGTAGSAHEVLIVVSKLKQYIKQQAAMHTADTVHGVLSDHVRHLCDQAMAHATVEGRKTVMDRDVAPFVDVP